MQKERNINEKCIKFTIILEEKETIIEKSQAKTAKQKQNNKCYSIKITISKRIRKKKHSQKVSHTKRRKTSIYRGELLQQQQRQQRRNFTRGY